MWCHRESFLPHPRAGRPPFTMPPPNKTARILRAMRAALVEKRRARAMQETRRSSGLPVGSSHDGASLPAAIHGAEDLFSSSESESGSEDDSEVEITEDEPEDTDLDEDTFQKTMTCGTTAKFQYLFDNYQPKYSRRGYLPGGFLSVNQNSKMHSPKLLQNSNN